MDAFVQFISDGEDKARERLANNGRNPANLNAGIRVGSDLHVCEMLLKEIERQRDALRKIANYSAASTIQPALIARATLKGEVW